MALDSDNANVNEVERASQATATELEPANDQANLEQLEFSGRRIEYSAESEIRKPALLLKNIYSDFLAGRELAWRLFVRNIRGLYRQTFLGLFWAFLPPIANTAMWIFLRNVANLNNELEVNATLYILTGMILWQAFIEAFQMPLQMLNKNRNMVSKLNFPRESLLLVGIGEVFFDLAIRMLLLIPAFFFFGGVFHSSMLLAPFAIIALVLFAMSLGLLIMPIGSLYQDVGRFIGMFMPFWMILTPIIYAPLDKMPGAVLNYLNPASPLLILARDSMLLGSSEHMWMGLIFGAATLPLVILGLIVYRVSIPVLVERMNA